MHAGACAKTGFSSTVDEIDGLAPQERPTLLIRFGVSNFRSILDPVELSMIARNVNENPLTVAGIFGPNASGKSNVIAALTWLSAGVRESLRCWDDGIPVEPFAFADGHSRPSAFVVESVISGVRFEYVVELDQAAVRYEGLFHYPEKKRRRIFEREGDDVKFQRGLGRLSGTRRLLTPHALVLSIARRFDEPVVSHFTRNLLAIKTHARRSTLVNDSTCPTIHLFDGSANADRAQALALLRMVDLSIEDVVVDRHPVSLAEAEPDADQPRIRHKVRLVRRMAGERATLDFANESAGTKIWFDLVGPVLAALKTGSPLLFDELDSSLHPTLSAQLIRLFHDQATNPQGAQLVFTAHDTSLLSHLNQDEVWLTEKTAKGSTRLGALPGLDRTELLRTLGLVS